MRRELRWLLLLGVATLAVVAAFIGVPGQQTDSMTAAGGLSPPPSGPTALSDLPPSVHAAYRIHDVAPAAAAHPVRAAGWTFEFPFGAVADTADRGRKGTLLASRSGVNVKVSELRKAVDWETQYLEAGEDARNWLIGVERQSEYSLYETVLSTTEAAARNLSPQRFRLAVDLKDALVPPSAKVVYALAVNGLRGFQIGLPESRRVTVLVLDPRGGGVVLELLDKSPESEPPKMSQAAVDAIVGSLQRSAAP